MFNSSTRLKFKPVGMFIRETNFRKKSLRRFCPFVLLEISCYARERLLSTSAEHCATFQFEAINFAKIKTSVNIREMSFFGNFMIPRALIRFVFSRFFGIVLSRCEMHESSLMDLTH